MRFLLLDLRSPVGPGFPFGPLNTYWMVNVIQLKSCLLVEDTNRSTSSMTFCKSYWWYITYKCSWINDLRNQIDDTISDYHSLVLLWLTEGGKWLFESFSFNAETLGIKSCTGDTTCFFSLFSLLYLRFWAFSKDTENAKVIRFTQSKFNRHGRGYIYTSTSYRLNVDMILFSLGGIGSHPRKNAFNCPQCWNKVVMNPVSTRKRRQDPDRATWKSDDFPMWLIIRIFILVVHYINVQR